jgi:hypothetical protein
MKSTRIKNWPKNELPREWLLTEGADKLTEAELLVIILRVGQGTFGKVVSIPPEDIEVTAVKKEDQPKDTLHRVREINRPYGKTKYAKK